MKNKNMSGSTLVQTNEQTQNNLANKKHMEKNRDNLSRIIEHLKSVHSLMEMRDALKCKIDTYAIDNLDYGLEDHRLDCMVYKYLNDQIQKKQRIKTDCQYAK